MIFIGGQIDGDIPSWSDGTNFDYINWASEGPSNNDGSCVVMRSETIDGSDGKWTPFQCDSALKYICKKFADLPGNF